MLCLGNHDKDTGSIPRTNRNSYMMSGMVETISVIFNVIFSVVHFNYLYRQTEYLRKY